MERKAWLGPNYKAISYLEREGRDAEIHRKRDRYKFLFSVQCWTKISAETERLNDTETETEIHTETEILAETDTETKSFRSLVCHIKNPGQIWEQQLVRI